MIYYSLEDNLMEVEKKHIRNINRKNISDFRKYARYR
jgi:hypothetical protein